MSTETIQLNARSAGIICDGLWLLEESFFLGDQAGRRRYADAQYLRETFEAVFELATRNAVPAQRP